MKRTLFILLGAITACLILVACTDISEGKRNGEGVSVVQQNGVQMPKLVETDNTKTAPIDASIEIPKAVRVDGLVYFDTGKTSTQSRCGVMDGEIIYSIPEGEMPVQDNQSNFGVGYGYQLGFEPDTVEVCIDGEWCIFSNARDFQDDNTTEVTQNSVKIINDGMLPCKISQQEAQTISDILSKTQWSDAEPKCLFDISFNIQGHIYNYSMSCGSFKKVIISGTPAVNSTQHGVVYGYSHVSDEEKQIINGIVSSHILIPGTLDKMNKE